MRHRAGDGTVARVAASALAGGLAAGCSLLTPGDTAARGVPEVTPRAAGAPGPAVARVDRPYGDYTLHVDIFSLRRRSGYLRLDFAVTPTSAGGFGEPLDSTTFSADDDSDVDAVSLVDPITDARLRPLLSAHDGEVTCACSHDLDDFPLDRPTRLYADFPAPPIDVRVFTVVIPGVGPIPGVAVS